MAARPVPERGPDPEPGLRPGPAAGPGAGPRPGPDPGPTPDVAPDAAPHAAPDAAPHAAPDAAPHAAPHAAPDAAPDAAPGPATVGSAGPASGAEAPVAARTRLAIGLACAAIFLVTILAREGWTVDDALIFQSYVRSALDGHGLSYAPGQHTEGYSSPLWTLLLVAVGGLGARGLQAARIVGALCGLATVLVVALGARTRRAVAPSLVAGALLAAQPCLGWWSPSGMETPLLALVLALAFAGAVRERPWQVALFGGLAAVTRPEGALYTFAATLWVLLDARRRGLAPRRLVAPAALLLGPALAWEAFRLASYGALVANSALAKLGASPVLADAGGVLPAVAYLAGAFADAPGPWILGGVALLAGGGRARAGARADLTPLAAAMALGAIAFAFAVGGDYMAESRLLVPVLPVLALLAAERWRALEGGARRVMAAAAALALVATGLGHIAEFSVDYVRSSGHLLATFRPPHRRPLLDPTFALRGATFYARNMLRYTVPGDVVMHVDIGQAGYLAHDVRILDQFGLVSRFECEFLNGRHGDEELVRHFEAERPSVAFVVIDPATGEAGMRVARPLLPVLARDYLLAERELWWHDTHILALVRRDAAGRRADPARLARWQAAAPGVRFDPAALLAEGPPPSEGWLPVRKARGR